MSEIQTFLNSPGENLPKIRERAMLFVAYDAMTRPSELIAIDVEDLKFLDDGMGRVLIHRSKSDQAVAPTDTYRRQEGALPRTGVPRPIGLLISLGIIHSN